MSLKTWGQNGEPGHRRPGRPGRLLEGGEPPSRCAGLGFGVAPGEELAAACHFFLLAWIFRLKDFLRSQGFGFPRTPQTLQLFAGGSAATKLWLPGKTGQNMGGALQQ